MGKGSSGEMQDFVNKTKKAIRILKNEGGRELYRRIKRRYMANPENSVVAVGENAYIGIAPFEAEYQSNELYDLSHIDVKTLAFYLPQFHAFKENNEWWGNGFSEWSNTRRCHKKRFHNHYQPRTPHWDIGYYDLSDFSVMEKQIKLAKEHGVYGFCFYYYWFSGKRLMELPVDQLLEHKEVDFPFCLCWANENWTRAWDGQKKDVLIEQRYSEDDPEKFIKDISKYVNDKRYIKINSKPLVMVYNPGEIPNCSQVFEKWREFARKEGMGEILIWVCATANNSVEKLQLGKYVDAEVEFPPHNMWNPEFAVRNLDLNGKEASIFDYRQLVDFQVKKLSAREEYCVPVHHACTLGWDNSARRENNWFTLYGFSLKSYYKWLKSVVENARANFEEEERFIFINAWNEWAEGTYLEPDEKYGYAYINTTTKALSGMPFDKSPCVYTGKEQKSANINSKICVQFHIYYVELLKEIVSYLNNIEYNYDCYISTDSIENKELIEEYFAQNSNCSKVRVDVFENRGRDVRPFLMQLSNIIRQYDYVGHFHSKITKTGNYGNDWRKYCYKHLLGSSEYLNYIFEMFESDSRLGIVFPPVYPVLSKQAIWGGNREGCDSLLKEIGVEYQLPTDNPIFPVGNMFWARTDAVLPLFERLNFDLFPEECGQVNATIAHCIERIWVYVAKARNYDYDCVFNSSYTGTDAGDIRNRIVLFVHYDSKNILTKDDIDLICNLRGISRKLVVISNNGNLPNEFKNELDRVADKVMYRDNQGFDFAAWRDAIFEIGREELIQYDQLLLVNNSMVGDASRLEKIVQIMDGRDCDFWGLTMFPRLEDGSFCGLDFIPEHIQSYFMAFNQRVLDSDVFYSFWNKVEDEHDIKMVIAKYEAQLTNILHEKGYSYDAYISESSYINYMLGDFELLYTKPWMYILLGLPMVKKKYKSLASLEDIEITDAYLEQIKK